jgi:hypothetical protein
MDLIILQKAIDEAGSVRGAARVLGINESSIRYHLKRASKTKQQVTLEVEEPGFVLKYEHNRLPPPIKFAPLDVTRYFILTAAQDATQIHKEFWHCLNIYAEWLEDCEIIVSGFTYNKKLFENHDERAEGVYFHEDINKHILHNQVHIGDKLVFCGEMNTLPTAVTPLSGFQTYTRDKWGIFPHVKVQLESVPTMKNELSKQIMTTGAVTLPNYVRKKAGIKAEFDHIIGATLVALDPDGTFWCRQIQATSLEDGSFYDLDCHITPNGVEDGIRVAGITYADIHIEKMDPVVAMATWGYDTVTRTATIDESTVKGFLAPEFEFYHDTCDFSTRNHHNVGDHHFILSTYLSGKDKVEDDLALVADFYTATQHPDTISVSIQSNHDNAYAKWVKTGIKSGVQRDPANYIFWLKSELMFCEYLQAGVKEPPIFEVMVRRLMWERNGAPSDDLIFHPEDTSFKVCGIECGMHGHLGANGAKASPNAFVRMGSKSNTGHVHSPGITSGNYRSGVCAMEMGYNKGLSSWATTHTVIYANGRRTLLTSMNGRFYE